MQAPKLNASIYWSQILITTLFLKVHVEGLAEKITAARRQAPLWKSSTVQDTANHMVKRKQNMLKKKTRNFSINLLLQLHVCICSTPARTRTPPAPGTGSCKRARSSPYFDLSQWLKARVKVLCMRRPKDIIQISSKGSLRNWNKQSAITSEQDQPLAHRSQNAPWFKPASVRGEAELWIHCSSRSWAKQRRQANGAGLRGEVRVNNSERGRIKFTFCTLSISLCLSNTTAYGNSDNASHY